MAPKGVLLHMHTLHSATNAMVPLPKSSRQKKRDEMNLSQPLAHERPTRLPFSILYKSGETITSRNNRTDALSIREIKATHSQRLRNN